MHIEDEICMGLARRWGVGLEGRLGGWSTTYSGHEVDRQDSSFCMHILFWQQTHARSHTHTWMRDGGGLGLRRGGGVELGDNPFSWRWLNEKLTSYLNWSLARCCGWKHLLHRFQLPREFLASRRRRGGLTLAPKRCLSLTAFHEHRVTLMTTTRKGTWCVDTDKCPPGFTPLTPHPSSPDSGVRTGHQDHHPAQVRAPGSRELGHSKVYSSPGLFASTRPLVK